VTFCLSVFPFSFPVAIENCSDNGHLRKQLVEVVSPNTSEYLTFQLTRTSPRGLHDKLLTIDLSIALTRIILHNTARILLHSQPLGILCLPFRVLASFILSAFGQPAPASTRRSPTNASMTVADLLLRTASEQEPDVTSTLKLR
jgi:hypothetical protein